MKKFIIIIFAALFLFSGCFQWADKTQRPISEIFKSMTEDGKAATENEQIQLDSLQSAAVQSVTPQEIPDTNQTHVIAIEPDELVFSLSDVSFKMIKVQGGRFEKTAMPRLSSVGDNNQITKTSVVIDDYYIGEVEVTQALWKSIMGSNPALNQRSTHCPVEMVSKDEVIKDFLPRLNKFLEKQRGEREFSLPTGAQWEYAAQGGHKGGRHFDYSGSNTLDEVGWYNGNSNGQTQPVAQKLPNELGLYDMTGNVWEMTLDNNMRYGGCYFNKEESCATSYYDEESPDHADTYLGLRLALSTLHPEKDGNMNAGNEHPVPSEKTFNVNGESLTMVEVNGGEFNMGAQSYDPDQPNYDPKANNGIEGPVHQVVLSSYYIGKYEVTQALWVAVMGQNPSMFQEHGDFMESYPEDLSRPVENVYLNDIENGFIPKLNELLKEELNGMRFALPTEAQWEYAARGGIYAGNHPYGISDNADEVAWFKANSGNMTHSVGTKKANELGIYDMNGNVEEWCRGWFNIYQIEKEIDPEGPETGMQEGGPESSPQYIVRGGSWCNESVQVRVSSRRGYDPNDGIDIIGFRLVLIPDTGSGQDTTTL